MMKIIECQRPYINIKSYKIINPDLREIVLNMFIWPVSFVL